MPAVALSRGTAALLEFKDQEATAGGLRCPHFTPMMPQKIKTGDSAVFNMPLEINSHDQMHVVTSSLFRTGATMQTRLQFSPSLTKT